MPIIYSYILLFTFLWLGNYIMYLCFNHGLAPNARRQQIFRYLPASIVAVLPLAITGCEVLQPAVLKILAITELWAVAYPLTYHLTFRKTSPDYDNQIDPAFAIYLFGIISGLAIMLPSWIMAPLYLLTISVPLFVFGYFVVYSHVVDVNGILPILQTNYNEALEFLRAYPLWRTMTCAVTVLAVMAGFVTIGYDCHTAPLEWWMYAIIFAVVIGVGFYVFKTHHGLVSRIGIVKLWLEVEDYNHRNDLYSENQKELMKNLQARCVHPLPASHTFLLIVGESASRDFMSAFTEMEEDTTPWMRELAKDKEHCVLFPNAYSCDIQTVPVLEKALTSSNQYDGGEFNDSVSVINIAKKLGYKIHWYSNQGYLGSADTPITLIAENADVAKWTNQQLGKKYYDGALTYFLSELDPTQNNFVVLHLMGSHFNYENRFPEDYRKWMGKDIHDKIINYKNTLYYTDCVLHEVFDFLRKEKNLQGMIYFSDHGDVPDRHRQPNFGGFKDTHIPLVVWLGDEHISARSECLKALTGNSDCYWTDDLLYDLVCGVMDVDSPVYKEKNSLSSFSYPYNRDNLTIMNGAVHISDDETMEKGL